MVIETQGPDSPVLCCLGWPGLAGVGRGWPGLAWVGWGWPGLAWVGLDMLGGSFFYLLCLIIGVLVYVILKTRSFSSNELQRRDTLQAP